MIIKLIIFDVGGVIVPEKDDEIIEEIAEYLDINIFEFKKIMEKLRKKSNKGEIGLRDVYERVVGRLKKNVNPDNLLKKHLDLYKKYTTIRNENVISLVKELRKKYKVIGLTNTEKEIMDFNYGRLLYDIFERNYTSVEIGFMKPEKEIFQEVFRDIGISPDKSLFIDDREENIISAGELGMRTIKFEDYEQLRRELMALKII